MDMRHFFNRTNIIISFFVLVACAAYVFANISYARADSGSLVRGSQSAVYYVNKEGERFAFPSEKIYRTWYDDFSGVERITDSKLASYSLSGVVRYRPGLRMVKITTDPKVYAVDKWGNLRWVKGELVANALYGDQWNTINLLSLILI